MRLFCTILAVMYRSTIRACYVGSFSMALVSNLTPLLFIILMDSYGLTFEQVGRLTLINFLTQIIADIAFSEPVDRWGVRPFVVAGHFCCAAGLVMFAISPMLAPTSPYPLFMLTTVIFSAGGGLLELLLSPIIQAIPGDEKAKAMSLLHSFYAWGFIAVVVVTTVLLALLGNGNWPFIMLGWSLLPLANALTFTRVPLAPQVSEDKRMPVRALLTSAFFCVAILGIATGGAAEVAMSQWISAFTERALGLSKQTGDLVGLCLFAALLGTGRALYGKFGDKIDVSTAMLYGAIGSTVCFLGAALSPHPLLSMGFCALNGLSVSLLWPGSIVLAAAKFPLAGASMFALLAAAGDTGASVGPWMIGLIADHAAGGLRTGLLIGAIFPLTMIFCMLSLRAKLRDSRQTMADRIQ